MSEELLNILTEPETANAGDQPTVSIPSTTPPRENAHGDSNSAATTARSVDSPVGEGTTSLDDQLVRSDVCEYASTTASAQRRRSKRTFVLTRTCTKRGKGVNNDGLCGRPLDAEDVGKYMRCTQCRLKDVHDKRKSLRDIAEGRGVRKHLGKRNRNKEREVSTRIGFD